MFRKAEAYEAHYHGLTLLVAADFDEWRVFLQGPSVWIHGGRQFNGAKAKEHALRVADSYLHEESGAPPLAAETVEWTLLTEHPWLNWRP